LLVSLPTAASLERTNAAMSAVARIARETEGVDGVVYISGFNLLTGSRCRITAPHFCGSSPGTNARSRRNSHGARRHAEPEAQRADQGRAGARPQSAADPRVEHCRRIHFRAAKSRRRRSGRALSRPAGLLAEARKRPEIGFVYSGFDPAFRRSSFRSTATR
jgi:multidrug efflux pump subunit AcrB